MDKSMAVGFSSLLTTLCGKFFNLLNVKAS